MMFARKFGVSLFSFLVLEALLFPRFANAGWINDDVQAVYYFPDLSRVRQILGTYTVPTGNIDLSGQAGGGSRMILTDNEIIGYLDPYFGTYFTPDPFNGVVLTDLTKNPHILNVSIKSEYNFRMPQSRITFTSNSISINWNGVGDGPYSAFKLDVAFSPIAAPEPGSLVILTTGLFGLGLLRRRRHPHQRCT